MASPSLRSDVANDSQILSDEKSEQIYEKGQDTDLESRNEYQNAQGVDLEKGAQNNTGSTHSDERTLSGEHTHPQEQPDPNVVDWDGPDDPENPQNWPESKKWGMIGALAAVTLVTPLASSFFAPGVPQVMETFDETSNLIASFVVSVYILGFAIGPLMIGPMSEMYGRMLVYHSCNALFVVLTVACAVSNSMGMLIAFRFLAGCAGAAPLTIGGGTIADIFPREKRAAATAIWSMGPLMGPVLGPVCGGFLVEAKGWRWVFWIITIFAGFFAILLLFIGKESYAPTLLERKAARLRKETGNPNLRSKMASGLPPKEIFLRAIVRPMKMLMFQPIVTLMSLYVALNYGVLYLLFTTMTFVFEDQYHFSSGAVGLAYIGIGIGMFMGMILVGTISDRVIKKHQAKGNTKPEHRLPFIITLPGGIALPIGIFIYGWTAHYKVHWIAPIIGTSFVGLGNLTSMMTIQTYLIDAYHINAASALAANTFLRSVFGGVLPLAGLSMYDSLGLGWGNSLLGFVSLALIPVPILFRLYGERIRTHPKFQVVF
ncbi:membrane transporter [Corynespora cassiicola Philippines]|uniref:Membrane transporter n=1 Tax=Corynespora cassiicola Philippines TaxID=1448308 RepID=A0A2T2N5S6_CORCC|nr:membrane transporter [Corynespora cassiicola Philippines]